jgi:hypothetical protein
MTPHQHKPKRSALVLFLCLFLLISNVSIHGQTQSEVAPPSKSDTYAVTVDGKKLRVQHREIAGTNFRISGVDLATTEEVLQQATKLFGKSPSVTSGDASTSNEGICYRSATENDTTYLIFGRGEVDSSLILSSDNSVWKGNHVCTRSGKITRSIATDSGLRLGLTQAQVIGILGLATSHSQNIQEHTDRLIYSLEARKKTDPQQLARLRKDSKESPEEFLRNSEFYALEVNIEARFKGDSLIRLNASWSAQY